MELEVRKISSSITNSPESRTVTGYAAVFESMSEDLGFTEIIHRGAITSETIKNSDVLAKFNHDDNKVLARSKYGEGSLLLDVDERGLSFLFDAPNTALGDELLEHLQRRDIDGASFAFCVSKEPNSEKWSKRSDGRIVREIFKISRLADISPVWTPAYSATSCSKRFSEIQATIDEVEGILQTYKDEIEKL